MSVMSNPQVGIYDYNENVVAIHLFQLLQWKHALKLEINTAHFAGGPMTFKGGRKISTHVRKFLSAPRNYAIQDMYQHIADSLDSINEQLGV